MAREFEIIDAHIHLTHSTEEEKNYWVTPGKRERDMIANPQGIHTFMDQNGISRMAFMVLIPRQLRGPLFEKAKLSELPEPQSREQRKKLSEQIAARQREYNEWGCEVGRAYPRLLPFIGMSEDLGTGRELASQLEQWVKKGAKGVKLHPGMYSFFPGDEVFFPMYAKAEELGIPILADSGPWPHSGVLITSALWFQPSREQVNYAEPVQFEPVLKAFPRLKLIMAHLGSAWWDERVELAKQYPNLLFDTSQGFSAPDRVPITPHRGLAEEDAVRIFRKIGVERIFFGTDLAGLPPLPQLQQLLRMDLTDDEKQKILAGNAKKVLGW